MESTGALKAAIHCSTWWCRGMTAHARHSLLSYLTFSNVANGTWLSFIGAYMEYFVSLAFLDISTNIFLEHLFSNIMFFSAFQTYIVICYLTWMWMAWKIWDSTLTRLVCEDLKLIWHLTETRAQHIIIIIIYMLRKQILQMKYNGTIEAGTTKLKNSTNRTAAIKKIKNNKKDTQYSTQNSFVKLMKLPKSTHLVECLNERVRENQQCH